MKKLILFLSLIASFIAAQSQITLLSTNPLSYVYLRNGITKFVEVDNQNNIITLFNLNNTVYKTINFPIVTVTGASSVGFVTETLFDTDTSNVEYSLTTYYSNGNIGTRIYREDGALLFANDSASFIGAFGVEPAGMVTTSIINTDSGTFMFMSYFPHESYTYSLPGKLACSCCNQNSFFNGNNPQSGIDNISVNTFSGLESSPNPSNNSTKVFYNLPNGVTHGTLVFFNLHGDEVKMFEVTNIFSYMLISTANLPAGIYVFRIETSQGISEGKQQVVVR